nr:unnamed protein product [Callosobruchus analis]
MLTTDTAEIKKKMQSLLASFRREKQKLKTTSGMGSEEIYDTKWFAFKSLLFLKDKNQPVKTQDTEGNVSKINENESTQTTQDQDLEENTDRDLNETVSNENHADNEEVIPKRKEFVSPKRIPRKKTKLIEDPRITDAYAVITDLKSNISAPTKDGCSAYGEHIAFKLRSYNSYTRAIVEHHINNIIFNADMGLYAQTNNSNIQLQQTAQDIILALLPPLSYPPLPHFHHTLPILLILTFKFQQQQQTAPNTIPALFHPLLLLHPL